ncbi:uncharacterized protein N0V89_008404 [Didymosphaeria variabile]|uniref:polynucleotide adenylyltransferase n=1 Tax=Didymosphaeria variabile TaxID=1932322 RepID=A0A9W8XI16_9PLEO|nr:uncharacterized protein N0V89_008404 [Didymosphaeria variabile]KAJ4349786.1 hypothetical protein N0V89_008404 [Didymosphaeria variabile]
MTGGPGGRRDRGGGDSYRPGQQQIASAPSRHDFTFTSDTQGPRFSPAPPERPARRNRGRGRGGPSGMNGTRPATRSGDAAQSQYRGGRRNNRGGFRPQAAHERALLQTRDDATERFLGVDAKSNKFRNLEDLSDDEEADMDVGTDDTDKSDGEVDASPNKTKAIRTQSSSRADGDSVPKWSNPDPYTVLPPPEETTGKRIDFVKLIRKAKNEVAEQENGANAVAANDDFISFGDENDDDDAFEPSVAPSGPAPRMQPLQGSLNDVTGGGSLAHADRHGKRPAEISSLPARPPPTGLPPRPTFTSSSTSSSRKRKHTDDYAGMKDVWQPKDRLDPAPWAFREDYERLRDQPEKLLHNEIADFYDFVAPSDHDNEVRIDLIRRVQSVIGGEFQSHRGSIRCFGSFPIGLYLPTADMDLVFVSDSHYDGGSPKLVAGKSAMYTLAKKLRFNQVAFDTFVIPKARVPIIKFKDIATGLPVDISFENMSGVIAQSTLSKWKKEHGDHFTCLIALVKQLLEMYNLNDNSTGGLGGLSICCLVASFLKLHKLPENLGQTFLQFLDFFGNKFNYGRDRIEVDPPRIVRKGKFGVDGRPEREDRLSIQDPNDAENNISGGSYKADKCMELFSWAHRILVERMDTIHMSTVRDLSILEAVLGGDYSTYQQQRERMRNVRIQ